MIGTLYLIPTPLGEHSSPLDACGTLPGLLDTLQYFIVENEKSSRRALKQLGFSRPISELKFSVLDEHTRAGEILDMLEPLKQGFNMGLLSEAGCPCVADPGATIVSLAHEIGALVRPLVGPSSIILALMASGLNGQLFAFNGYVPIAPTERHEFIRSMERASVLQGATQIFMDTPYRSDKLVGDLLATCQANTQLCIAINVTQPGESIITKKVGDWRSEIPQIGKQPTMFLLSAARKK